MCVCVRNVAVLCQFYNRTGQVCVCEYVLVSRCGRPVVYSLIIFLFHAGPLGSSVS